MFQKLKSLFSKNKHNKSINSFNEKTIKFKDIYGQEIEISIKLDGNSNILVIKEVKNDYKVVLDKEMSTLISCILMNYGKNGNINNLTGLFDIEEGNE